jgi:hypothetical protein
MYWDGQQWSSPGGPPVPQQMAISPDALRAAMAENRSIWVTNGLAVWSLICGILGALLLFFCGAGIGPGAVGVIVGILAYNKSKQTGAGRGMALGGLITSSVVVGIGLIVLVAIFGLGSM